MPLFTVAQLTMKKTPVSQGWGILCNDSFARKSKNSISLFSSIKLRTKNYLASNSRKRRLDALSDLELAVTRREVRWDKPTKVAQAKLRNAFNTFREVGEGKCIIKRPKLG